MPRMNEIVQEIAATAGNMNEKERPALPLGALAFPLAGFLQAYIFVQVCDLHSTFSTQPCSLSDAPLMAAEPL